MAAGWVLWGVPICVHWCNSAHPSFLGFMLCLVTAILIRIQILSRNEFKKLMLRNCLLHEIRIWVNNCTILYIKKTIFTKETTNSFGTENAIDKKMMVMQRFLRILYRICGNKLVTKNCFSFINVWEDSFDILLLYSKSCGNDRKKQIVWFPWLLQLAFFQHWFLKSSCFTDQPRL